MVTTEEEPEKLLSLLKEIEAKMGREKGGERFGPRVIDLDILFYDDLLFETEHLIIPHPRIFEREFVLGPLNDFCPDFIHPRLNRKIHQLYAQIEPKTARRVVPIRNKLIEFGKRTFLMGVLNVTPESFSDGGKFLDLDKAIVQVKEMVSAGADVVDVGGQSTRPGADVVSVEEEKGRVVPLIKKIREMGIEVPISIDTFNSEVAREAITAGADIINDVSGGKQDKQMMSTAASLHAPIIINHMRGTPKTMTSQAIYKNLLLEVTEEISQMCSTAFNQGVYRWNVVIDPGLGFSKTAEHSVAVLKNANHFKKLGFPMLIGPSKKGFIGTILQQTDPTKRNWGTAAACVAAVQQGADLIRVHDVAEMKDVVKVADALYRS
eukprot:TRINITY_DN2470_c0_g4_i2.p1 TRINITY_DN2470_c0_g4~~TRINITY_DN2470_c0_g4_i2.p1  ORF type:complete len:379 (+),score=110.23 TRINITY_DN2470_c0_g4_i2:812-1948(+)